ncbi:contractile injection system protein, VgrG/Pvc8 family [Brevibacillus laterosporus]|uniref:phage late control D family protein n=1 Tax=Brevibacillus laterosporus TaxID=1465 RepID=UPI003D2639AA
MTKARSAKLKVMYKKKDLTADLLPHLLGWTYTDNLSGQADDLQLTLEDVDQLWSGKWLPDLYTSIQATIQRDNWDRDGIKEVLPLGFFEIDEIEVKYPPSTVSIKGISIPETTSLRGEKKNKAWEKTKLSVIAKEKAKKAGLKLYFDTKDNPSYDRIEQTEETDLVFLQRLCNDAGLCLKVSGTQINIFDEEKYEKSKPIATLKRDKSEVKSYQGRTKTTGMYRACTVTYFSAKSKKKNTATFTPPKAPKTGRTLKINERVNTVAEALRLAKKKLREANREATQVSLRIVGNHRFVAGVTVQLDGFGTFDGKYIITQATHTQSSGYETSLELRRCLEGY